GGGTLAAYNNNGVGTYTAPATAGRVVLRLQRQSGPGNRTIGTYPLNIVAPSGARIVRDPSAPLYHRQNTCSVGFSGLVYLSPRNVSFRGLIFREGTSPPPAPGLSHPLDSPPLPPA